LFNDAVIIETADELGSIWKEMVMACLKYYPGISLEEMRKATKNFSQDNRYPS
jgi:hypothetical protein